MKKIYLLALVFAFGLNQTFAQITITSADLPEVGDVYKRDSVSYKRVTNSVFSDVFSDANGNLWDASWLKGNGLDTIKFSSPTGTVYQDSFPSANLVMAWDFDFIIDKNSSGLNVLGLGVESEVRSFDSSVNYTPVPLNFGDKSLSKGKASFPFLSYQVSVELERSIEAVKYGSVKMPNDSVYEVLVVEAFTDFSNLIILGADTISNNQELEHTLEFYAKEFGFPLVRVVLDNTTNQPDFIEFINTNTPTSIQIKSLNADLSIYPNPSSGSIQLLTSGIYGKIELYEMSGKLLTTEVINGQNIKIEGLEKGTYLCKLFSADGKIAVQRVVVQ